MQVIAADAEFERDLLIERNNSGIKRGKIEGNGFVGRLHCQAAGSNGASIG